MDVQPPRQGGNTEQNSSLAEKFFGLVDLLKERMSIAPGNEREIGEQTSRLTQLTWLGDRQDYFYFGLLRQLRIEKRVDRQLMKSSRIFLDRFRRTIKDDRWKGTMDSRRAEAYRTEANLLSGDLEHAINMGWNRETATKIKECETLLEKVGAELEEENDTDGHDPGAAPQDLRIQIGEEEIDPDVLYHYELVRARSNTPKTFVMLNPIFQHSEQRKLVETSQGQFLMNKFYRFLFIVGWVAFTAITQTLQWTGYTPSHSLFSDFVVPAGVSIGWVFVLYFVAKWLYGATWVVHAIIKELPVINGTPSVRAVAIVNSKTLDYNSLIVRLSKGSKDFLQAIGETLISFQEATFARMDLAIRSKNLRISALEDREKKQQIQEESRYLRTGRPRAVRKSTPVWAIILIPITVILGVFLALVAIGA